MPWQLVAKCVASPSLSNLGWLERLDKLGPQGEELKSESLLEAAFEAEIGSALTSGCSLSDESGMFNSLSATAIRSCVAMNKGIRWSSISRRISASQCSARSARRLA